MDKTYNTTKPSKPAIGSKLQRNPFLANEQSNSDNLGNQKPAPVKKKTTAPAWLQKSEFSSSKRASLQKMTQKVTSNPWKKTAAPSVTTKSDSKTTNNKTSSGSKLPTLPTNSNKTASSSSSSSSTTTITTTTSKVPKPSTTVTSTKVPMSAKSIPSTKISINKGSRSPADSTKSISKIQQHSRSAKKTETSVKENEQQQKKTVRTTAGTRNIEKNDVPEAVISTATRASIIDKNPASEPKSESSLPTKPTSRLYDTKRTDNVDSASETVSDTKQHQDPIASHAEEPDPLNKDSISVSDHQPNTNSSSPQSQPLAPSQSALQQQPPETTPLPPPAPISSPAPSLSISTPSQAMSKSNSVSSSTSDLLSELLPPPEPSSLADIGISSTKFDTDTVSSIDFGASTTLYHHQPGKTSTNSNRDSLFDIVLPWSQHSQEQIQHVEKQHQHFGNITLDYDTFFQQLVVSHAISSSLFFPTVSFDQAQKLQKKYLKSNDHIDMIGTRLLMETKAQRMILAMHKLSTHAPPSTNSASTNTNTATSVEDKESDRLDQVDRLVEELIQWMHHDYSRREQYLQHLAGTLAQQCTHLEQVNHSITMESSSSFTLSTTPSDHTIMIKKEIQWIMALRQEIIQLFEHHLPSVPLPSSATSTSQHIPPLSTSYSRSMKSLSASSTSSHISAIGLGNDDDDDTFYNSNRTSMTSMMTDQQAHLYHRHHQNIVQEMKQFIQLLDRQLTTPDTNIKKESQAQHNNLNHGYTDSVYNFDATKRIDELEASLKNEKRHNESLATQLTDLQQKWHHEIQQRQTLDTSHENREKEHQQIVDQLKLALEQQEKQYNQALQAGAPEWKQEHQQMVNQLTVELDEEKQQRQALEIQVKSHQQCQHQQQNDLDQERQRGVDLQSQLDQLRQANEEKQKQLNDLNGILDKQKQHAVALESKLSQWQHQHTTLANQYSFNDNGNGDATIEMALSQLSKERDEARLETQEWQSKVQGMESELQDWQVKMDGVSTELQTKNKALETLHSNKSTSDLQMGALESQLHHLQAEHQELQREYEHRQELLRASELKLSETTHHNHELTEQVTNLKHQHQQHVEKQQHYEMENISNQNQQEDWKKKYLDLEDRLEKAQQQFTHRESGYLLQSASLEAELEQILKEYDRLTRHIMDFNLERKKYEEQISDMNQHQHRLDQQLADLQVQVLGMNDSQGTTMTLRKEFRQLMAQTKATHQQQLDKEQQLRSALEQERRDEKQEQERLRWDRVNVSVQTHFVV